MSNKEKVYRELQRHLDSQAVGFPATKSGAEIRLLKHIFSPEEAQIALCLDYRPEPVEKIYTKAKKYIGSPESLSKILDTIEKRGGIESIKVENKKHYFNVPLIVGMYEGMLHNLTPEFIEDFEAYTSDPKFGVALLSTELPQQRTIPIEKSIETKSNVSTFDEAKTLLKQAVQTFAIWECICRKKKRIVGEPCKATDRLETCLVVGEAAQRLIDCDKAKQIDLNEAIDILEKNQKQGLVLQPSNTEKVDFICSCCGCCCGMLAIHKQLAKPVDFWASNFYAAIDAESCDSCGVCERRCQVEAAKIPSDNEPASIDLNRCIGCGLCVPVCPKKAIKLEKKASEVKPPTTREDLVDIIMAKKKGKIGKLKVTGKLVVDAVTTGQTHLLKKN